MGDREGGMTHRMGPQEQIFPPKDIQGLNIYKLLKKRSETHHISPFIISIRVHFMFVQLWNEHYALRSLHAH